MIKKLTIVLAFASLIACAPKAAIENMKCESMVEPILVESATPQFSWTYSEAAGLDFVEAGYTVDVAESVEALEGAGMPQLKPFTDYLWRVTAWNEDKSKVLVSEVSRFSTGPMSMSDWTASWITDSKDKDDTSVPMLRKDFSVKKDLKKAVLYMSAAAYAEMTINGKKAFDARLEPGYTAYNKRNLFTAYDVTEKLSEGENCIGAVLGNGFYNEIKPVATWGFETAPWRGRARMIAELHVYYKDGTKEVVVTDDSWKTTAEGPYISNNIYAGDVYDARKEIKGWNLSGFDASAWQQACVVEAPSPVLSAQLMQPIAPVKRIAPVAVKSWGDTLYMFDFGENMAGVCELSVKGEEGTRIAMTHGEIQLEDGTMELCNIDCYFNYIPGYNFQQDVYYMKGGEKEVWSPSFNYHGFRYVEVKTDRPMKLDKSNLTAIRVHTDVPSKGEFECSDEVLNQVWVMARRTYLNNLHSIFTDCPQREKNGWTADNFLTTELGFLNFDVAPYFLNKWVLDVIDNIREDGRISGIMPDWGWGYLDWIGPVWDSSIFTIAEYAYDYTGVTDHIELLWPVWKKYLEYLKTREEVDGLPTYGIGDWVYLNVATPTEFTTPCFYYKDYCVMARFAPMMGEDPSPYLEKAKAIREAINAKWFNYETNLYANGSQAAQGVALFMGIVPEGREQAVADNLNKSIIDNNYLLEFGSMGSKTVPRMLTKYGHVQTAYTMAAKKESPNWGGWIEKGMTSLCETWVLRADWRDASLNHAFLGDIAAWYVSDLAGINCALSQPGFEHIVIAPHFPEGLNDVSASYDSVKGRIASSWKRQGDAIVLEVEIPVGCTGELRVDGRDTVSLKPGKNKIRL